jgi:hypothetical protein
MGRGWADALWSIYLPTGQSRARTPPGVMYLLGDGQRAT